SRRVRRESCGLAGRWSARRHQPDGGRDGPVESLQFDVTTARMPEDGSRVILTWNLDRAGEWDDADARARLREQAAAMSRALAVAEVSAATRRPAIRSQRVAELSCVRRARGHRTDQHRGCPGSPR